MKDLSPSRRLARLLLPCKLVMGMGMGMVMGMVMIVLFVRREPQNEHDSNAIAIESKCGKRIGYVPREAASLFANIPGSITVPSPTLITISHHHHHHQHFRHHHHQHYHHHHRRHRHHHHHHHRHHRHHLCVAGSSSFFTRFSQARYDWSGAHLFISIYP